jgi:hypothetical protein
LRAGAVALLLALAACNSGTASDDVGVAADGTARVAVTIATAGGPHVFRVERAATPAAQAQGLMFRTDLKPDEGMLFHPYPAAGGGPQVANFFMKNTPSPLDILFIREDGTIARIAENTVPLSESLISSQEPVSAVLELVGGRSAELGIAEGDKVTWTR